MTNTILRLTGMGIPPYSARGISQTLTSTSGASVQRRTINGTLTDVSDPLFQKYVSNLQASDVDPPALEGRWPGMQLTVDCIPELVVEGEADGTEESTTELSFARTHVPGSVRQADGFIFYRPQLVMLITAFSVNHDEWGRVVNWSMDLEEV